MRAVLVAAWVFLMLAASHARAQENTRTHRFFEGVGDAGSWLWERGKDAAAGLGDATGDRDESMHNERFATEVDQARQEWNSRLQNIADIISRMDDIPSYCRDPSAIELWPNMPDQCVTAIDMHLVEVQTELELLRNEIHAARQMDNGG